jgi:hypothetical protein
MKVQDLESIVDQAFCQAFFDLFLKGHRLKVENLVHCGEKNRLGQLGSKSTEMHSPGSARSIYYNFLASV